MTNSQNPIDAMPWKKISRRWITVLCTMLVINGVTVGLAICDWAITPQFGVVAANAGESTDNALATEQQASDTQGADPDAPNVAQTSSTTDSIAPTASFGGEEPAAQRVEAAQTIQPIVASAPAGEASITADNRNSFAEPAQDTIAASVVGANNPPVSEANTNENADARVTDAVVIINPPTTGGVVHYQISSQTISLLPGEYFRLSASDKQRVAFHRGDDLSDAELFIDAGAYVFNVSDAGWDLVATDGVACKRLLIECRPVASSSEGD